MKARSDRSTAEPGLVDVARGANVSIMTVSRALRDPDKVSKSTRERIYAVVRDLGYIPNLAARSLVSSKSRIVAAVVPSISNAMFAETLHAMSDVLRARGYYLTVAHSGYSLKEERAVIEALLGQRPCGIFLHNTTHTPDTVRLLRKQGLPVVETGDLIARPIHSVVSYSNFEAGKTMTEHLVSRGYRRIAYASAPRLNNERARQRLRGYLAALALAGLAHDRSLEFEGLPDPLVGARLLQEILARRGDVDAIFFSSERLAIGAYFECQRTGIPVPERVAIAGFDFYEMNNQVFPAGITTIITPRARIGRVAAETLLEQVSQPIAEPVRIDLGFELAERGTT